MKEFKIILNKYLFILINFNSFVIINYFIINLFTNSNRSKLKIKTTAAFTTTTTTLLIIINFVCFTPNIKINFIFIVYLKNSNY